MGLQDILNPAPPAGLPPAPPRFRGHISSPPPPGSPLAYNEDTIVRLILSIFNLLIRIGHIRTLSLVCPGDPRYQINEALCAELNLDRRVTLLLKRLPFYAEAGHSESIMIAPGSFLPNYLDPEHLRQGRHLFVLPGYAQPEPGWPGLRPQDVILLYNIEFDRLSETWILDTEASMFSSLVFERFPLCEGTVHLWDVCGSRTQPVLIPQLPGPDFIIEHPACTLHMLTLN